ILCHTGTALIGQYGEDLPRDQSTGLYIDWSGRGWSLDPPTRRLGSPKPHQRYHDILHHTTLASEFWGLIRRDALSKTTLLRSYFGFDRPLLAALALAGRFHSISEKLFFLRRHPAHASSQSVKARAEVVTPAASPMTRMSSALVYRDFGRAIATSE